jgi:putative transposase
LLVLAACRRRFGYLRLHLLLRREGFAVNHKKPIAFIAKRSSWSANAAVASVRLVSADHNAGRRSLDFVSDAFADGRRFRVLCIVCDFTRECLGLVADTLLSVARVARELDAIIALRGKPQTIVSDNVLRQELRGLEWQQIP